MRPYPYLLAVGSIIGLSATVANGAAESMSKSGSGQGRDYSLSLPLVAMGGEGAAKLEFNLGGKGSLSLVWAILMQTEAYSKSEIREHNQDSLQIRGNEAALMYTRYTNAKTLSGGYWALGAGLRKMRVDWERTPDAGFALDRGPFTLDEDGRATHTLTSQGPAAHARIGYRYVGESIPLSIGAYLGLRHYLAAMRDGSQDGLANTTKTERDSLERRFMTGIEPGIEFGLAI